MTETQGMPDPGAGPRRSGGRGLKIALGLSLAVNLLILGLVAGTILGAFRARDDAGGVDNIRALGLGPMAFVLREEDREAMRARTAAERDRFRPDVRGLVVAFRDFRDALRAEPFDRDRAAAALAAQRRHVLGLQETGQELLLDQIEAMGPEARADLADRLERRLRRVAPRAELD